MRDERGPRPREVEVLGDVSGLRLLHLQCHFGLDSLAWARAGALVTGIDFSPAAVDAARDIADRAGLSDRATFVCGDVRDAVETLGDETFDIVYVSLGALCWLPSVDRWASQVAALVSPGGRFYLHDGHPLAWALADDEARLAHSYFEETEPHAEDSPETYTDADRPLANQRTYEWNHGIGETVTALLRHGLRLDWLVEHDWTVWPRFPWLVRGDEGHWRTPPGMPRIPLTFSLLAQRPTLGKSRLDSTRRASGELRAGCASPADEVQPDSRPVSTTPRARYDGLADWYDELFQEYAASAGSPGALLAALLGTGTGRCLDVGCGTGLSALALRQAGHAVVGLDVSADQLRIGRTRCPWVVRGDAVKLPFASASVECAAAMFLHTDIDDFTPAVAEITRVLEPGGIFAYIGIHPCFVGHHIDSPAKSDTQLRLVRGYREANWVFDSEHFGPGVRGRIGARHVPLAELLTAFLRAGLILEVVAEHGDGIIPWMLAVRAKKPLA